MMHNRHTKTETKPQGSYNLLKNMDKEVKPWPTTCYLNRGLCFNPR
jgi:hypothetical protein